MAPEPTCSVVVRCYNEERHLARLLEGILQQTVKDVQVVLVDSGSTDRTLEIASRYPVDLVEIKKEEFSFGRSLNRGCGAARGEVLVLASAHVYPRYSDWLERLLENFADQRVALVYGKQRGDQTSRYSERQLFTTWFPDLSDLDQSHPFCSNANAAVRRSVWEAMPYDESLTGLEDIAWARKALARGHRLVYEADAEIVHVHEETAAQIFNRYEREAIALKSIYSESRFGLGSFLRLAASNIAADWRQSVREGVLLRHLLDVPFFRLLQFWGTYRGYARHGPVTAQLRNRFYYPRRESGPEAVARADARRLDYSDLEGEAAREER